MPNDLGKKRKAAKTPRHEVRKRKNKNAELDLSSPEAGHVEWSDEEDLDVGYNSTSKPKDANRLEKANQESDESDGSSELPPFLRKRLNSFLQAKTDAGKYCLPPDYTGTMFDQSRQNGIATRPDFRNAKPRRPYTDIVLEQSCGVIPAPIAQWLRDYQIDGTKFLHLKGTHQQGGVLGDDMGLGKTIQVIAFLTCMFGKTGDARDELRMREMRSLDRWYPIVLIWGWWHVGRYHSSGGDREDVLVTAFAGFLEIMLIPYSTYRTAHAKINQVNWDCVIADECHTIKQRKSETTIRMQSINALCRIGLTGTALQNTYEELFTLLNWANPGKLGTRRGWRIKISDPLKKGQAHNATNHQLATARLTSTQLKNKILPPFFLRRAKALIADQLPTKLDKVVFCPMTVTQQKYYKAVLNTHDFAQVRQQGKCPCVVEAIEEGRVQDDAEAYDFCKIHDKGFNWHSLILQCITHCQMTANHLSQVIPRREDPIEKYERRKHLLLKCLGHDGQRLLERNPLQNYADPELCGKWAILENLLSHWRGEEAKVLIFSYSVRLLSMLRDLFIARGYPHCYLDGKMKVHERTEEVDKFNNDPTQYIFLISTKAGGVGLNIVSANRVVIFDPNWNPAHDLQAQDRAFRIGQLRNVEVYRLISMGTIEENVYARQIYKQQQANIVYEASKERRYFKGIQGKPESHGELFGLENLMTFVDDNMVLKDILHTTNIAEAKVANIEVIDDTHGAEDQASSEHVDEASSWQGLAAVLSQSKQRSQSNRKEEQADAIAGILQETGVLYSHNNADVLAGSAVEAQLSDLALKADPRLRNLPAFMKDINLEIGDYQFHPPEDVKCRQFAAMYKMFKYPNLTEFAIAVELMTQKERANLLTTFYLSQRSHKARR